MALLTFLMSMNEIASEGRRYAVTPLRMLTLTFLLMLAPMPTLALTVLMLALMSTLAPTARKSTPLLTLALTLPLTSLLMLALMSTLALTARKSAPLPTRTPQLPPALEPGGCRWP